MRKAIDMERHDLDPLSLVFGVVFAAIGGLALLAPAGALVGLLHARWVWPALLIVLGLALLASLRRSPDLAAEDPNGTTDVDR